MKRYDSDFQVILAVCGEQWRGKSVGERKGGRGDLMD